jgi:drug/metabolite transporter (DMT)-like permease
VPVAAHFLLGEPWSWNTLIGGGIIMLGVIIALR